MKMKVWCAFAPLGALLAASAQAAVLYSGGTYSQSFDSLPNAPTDANVETTAFTDGWQDDVDPATSPQNDISIPGWYLWHSVSPTSENGFNGNQRMRIGAGGSNTGAFWSYGSAGSQERALGSLGSTTIANQPTGTPPANDTRVLTALRLTNNTSDVFTEFTVNYDGEQWRDGGNTAPPPAEVLLFDYSLASRSKAIGVAAQRKAGPTTAGPAFEDGNRTTLFSDDNVGPASRALHRPPGPCSTVPELLHRPRIRRRRSPCRDRCPAAGGHSNEARGRSPATRRCP
jgi:hypothetical protein